MSRYIQWVDVVGRYPAAAQIAGNTNVGSYWLPGAESEVDARLAGRYAVPFSTAPALVQDLCIDLTYCKMTAGQASSTEIYERYLERVTEIVAGTMLLTGADGTIIPSRSVSNPSLAWSSNSYRSSFGPDAPENWSPSLSAEIDAESERDYD